MATPNCRGALLMTGYYFSTLAAARELGKAGIPIALADTAARTHTGVSRYTRTFYPSPDYSNLVAFARWLIAFGRKNPGYFLYPTSDDLAWIIAHYQEELRESFFLYQAPEKATYSLLNKEKLTLLAHSLGIPTPKTWFPRSLDEVRALGQHLTYPVIVKPKTQIGLVVCCKGIIARTAEELEKAFEVYRDRFPYKPELLTYDSSLSMAMVQEYFPTAAENIVSIAGFIDATGELQNFRSSIKKFQRPVKVGVGIGFESIAVCDELRERTRRIAQEAGYFGVFEVEYIRNPNTGECLLIDFNARFYGQMGFEIARNLPLSRLAYAGACGDHKTMQELIKRSYDQSDELPVKALVQTPFQVLVTTQWLGRRMSWKARQEWLTWSRQGKTVDLLYERGDDLPDKLEKRNIFRGAIRSPFDTWRDYFR